MWSTWKSRYEIFQPDGAIPSPWASYDGRQADKLACEAWNKRMLAFQGPAQPSPTLGDALNAGYLYLEVKCLGYSTHQTVVPRYNPPAKDHLQDDNAHHAILARCSSMIACSFRWTGLNSNGMSPPTFGLIGDSA